MCQNEHIRAAAVDTAVDRIAVAVAGIDFDTSRSQVAVIVKGILAVAPADFVVAAAATATEGVGMLVAVRHQVGEEERDLEDRAVDHTGLEVVIDRELMEQVRLDRLHSVLLALGGRIYS